MNTKLFREYNQSNVCNLLQTLWSFLPILEPWGLIFSFKLLKCPYVCLWTSHLNCMCLSFFIYKVMMMIIIIIISYKVVVRNNIMYVKYLAQLLSQGKFHSVLAVIIITIMIIICLLWDLSNIFLKFINYFLFFQPPYYQCF